MAKAPTRDIIAIGGSTGSIPVLQKVFQRLPPDLRASIFVTTHLPPTYPSYLPQILGSASPIRVFEAVDGQAIEKAHAYIAAPDRHLLILDSTLRLGDGPRENLARPSIDAMFRSMALAFGPRVVGVVLSGGLNDGAAGLRAIKSCGGTAVVQHPLDAEMDEMPLAALEVTDVDHVASAEELPLLLTQLIGSEAGPPCAPSDDLLLEVEIAAGRRLGSKELALFADPTPFTCPDCQGVLSQMHSSPPLRFRCQIGHAFTAEVLAAEGEDLHEAIKLAMRLMEERLALVEKMARDARGTSRTAAAELLEARAQEFGQYAAVLRKAATSMSRARRTSK